MPQMVKIEKGVPIPPRAGRPGKYPWKTMEIGDSFVARVKTANGFHSTAARFGLKVRVSQEKPGQFRVWRIDPKAKKTKR